MPIQRSILGDTFIGIGESIYCREHSETLDQRRELERAASERRGEQERPNREDSIKSGPDRALSSRSGHHS